MPWTIEYYQSGNGKYTVEVFIDSLEVKSQARIARMLDLREEFGIGLVMPYARYLEKQLCELKCSAGAESLPYYLFTCHRKNLLIALWIFKETEAVPRADFEIAHSRRDDYLSRRRKG
jgi:hypothetical protein